MSLTTSSYILSFDVETTGEHHDLLSTVFVVLDGRSYEIVESAGYVITPRNKHEPISVADDYKWGQRCWDEFGQHHTDVLNATQNDPWHIHLSYDEASRTIRQQFDELCQKYEPLVTVDNAAFHCYHLNKLFGHSGQLTIEYQMNSLGKISYRGVTDTSSILSYIKSSQGRMVARAIRNLVRVPNDHITLNDARQHAILAAHLFFPRR